MSGFKRFGLLLLLALPLACAHAAERGPFPWPDGRKAAVSLAYDDALASQLDVAIPALDRVGLKGSFYLQLSRDPVRERMADWRKAAANGHELGNHTLFHQCSASLPGHQWAQPAQGLDTTSAARMIEQVRLANVMLTAIDGKLQRTLTVPCGDALAEGENYVTALAADFVAIKLGQGAVTPDMWTLDPYAVTVEAPEGVTGQQLIERVRQAINAGTMVNFTFHGVGGDYLSISRQAHDELLAYLAAHGDEVWVDTFINIMRYVRERQSEAR